MVRKQISLHLCRTRLWRRSNQALLFLSLLFVSTYAFSADADSVVMHPSSGKVEDARFFPEYSAREIELQDRVFNAAPKFAQNLVRHLQNPDELGVPHMRAVLFVGEPGTGKTTMAYAIARKAGWFPELIVPTSVRSGTRSETSLILRQKLDDVTEYANKTLIICDEIETLFAHPERENDDTRETATAFWQWLDDLKNHPKQKEIFFIGTTNNLRGFARPFKGRFSGKIWEFRGCSTSSEKADALMWHLNSYDYVDRRVSLEVLTHCFEKYSHFNGRDFEVLADTAKLHATKERAGEPLTYACIKKSFKELQQERKENDYYRSELSDAERQDSYHNQSLFMQAASLAAAIGVPAMKKIIG